VSDTIHSEVESYSLSLIIFFILECPTCYGLIEDFILEKRAHILQTHMDLIKIMSQLSNTRIVPFYQEITALRAQITNLTARSVYLSVKSNGLDLLWRTLNEKIDLFLQTLDSTTYLKVESLLKFSNHIFTVHNTTMFQYAGIHQYLVTSYYILQNTVRARMEQHNTALTILQNLGTEMKSYMKKATSAASHAMTKKYDLMQKIKLSYEASQTAVARAIEIRADAFNLTAKLTPVNARAIQVKLYAQTCVGSIDAWLKNATTTLVYAQGVIRTIEITLPDYSTVSCDFSYLSIYKKHDAFQNVISRNQFRSFKQSVRSFTRVVRSFKKNVFIISNMTLCFRFLCTQN